MKPEFNFGKAKKYLLFTLLPLFSTYIQLVSFSSCQKTSVEADNIMVFDSIPTVKKLNPAVNEISGIADSKRNPGYIWGQEDSGHPPQLCLIKHDGTLVKRIYIKGASNRDWEDMTLAGNEIFIAETGDNAQTYTEYGFYKFPEPALTTDTVIGAQKIRFRYADGSHDAEAFLVDPDSKEIYIITKRDKPSRLYKIAYPYSFTDVNTAELVASLPYSGVVGAAISADGKEIIIKTYPALFYYTRKPGESVEQSIQKEYTKLAYKMEPMGEAVTFAADNSGFFTLSEKGFGSSVNLYFYKRK